MSSRVTHTQAIPEMERFLFPQLTTLCASARMNEAYPEFDRMSTLEFRIHGMDCAEEVAVLRQEVGPVVGGTDNLAFDLLHGKMTVLVDTAGNASDILSAIRRTGMKAELWRDEDARSSLTETDTRFLRKHGRVL